MEQVLIALEGQYPDLKHGITFVQKDHHILQYPPAVDVSPLVANGVKVGNITVTARKMHNNATGNILQCRIYPYLSAGDGMERLKEALADFGTILDYCPELVPHTSHGTGNLDFVFAANDLTNLPPAQLKIQRQDYTESVKLSMSSTGRATCHYCRSVGHTREKCPVAPLCKNCKISRSHAPFHCTKPKGSVQSPPQPQRQTLAQPDARKRARTDGHSSRETSSARTQSPSSSSSAASKSTSVSPAVSQAPAASPAAQSPPAASPAQSQSLPSSSSPPWPVSSAAQGNALSQVVTALAKQLTPQTMQTPPQSQKTQSGPLTRAQMKKTENAEKVGVSERVSVPFTFTVTPPSSQRSSAVPSELDVEHLPAIQSEAEPTPVASPEAVTPTAESQSGGALVEGPTHDDAHVVLGGGDASKKAQAEDEDEEMTVDHE